MLELAIIADDLTGAADCAAPFATAGLPTFVALGNAPAPPETRILALDVDSRALPADAAAERTGAAARSAIGQRARVLYKKIDSTLRGQPGAEIAAVFRAVVGRDGKVTVVATPAFPAMGRTLRNGRLLVNGVPLESTELWSGSSGDLVAMLEVAGLEAVSVGLSQVRAGALDAEADAIVCDAESEDDLRRIAEAGVRLRASVVWAGSAGLARHLPDALGLCAPESGRLRFEPRPGPVLALVGSASAISREQAKALSAEPGVQGFELDPQALLAGDSDARWARAVEGPRRALEAGHDVVLRIGATAKKVDAPAIATALGRLAAPLSQKLGGLVATGGEIARAAAVALGARGIRLVAEVEPGVPLGLLDAPLPLPIVTKGGAFGTPSTLKRCRAALKGGRD